MSDMNKPTQQRHGSTLVGVAIAALCIVGVGSALAAITALENGDYTGVGACAVASALSFGMLVNALLRS